MSKIKNIKTTKEQVVDYWSIKMNRPDYGLIIKIYICFQIQRNSDFRICAPEYLPMVRYTS